MSTDKLTADAQTIIKQAKTYASSLHHAKCESPHLLKALLGQASIRELVAGIGADFVKLEQETDKILGLIPQEMGFFPSIVNAPDLTSIIDRAKTQSRSEGRDTDVPYLFLAIFKETSSQALYALQVCDIKREEVYNWFLKTGQMGVRTQADKVEEAGLEAAEMGQSKQRPRRSAIVEFCVDLTDAAKSGKLMPVIGRDEEIADCFRILLRKTKNNPVLVGEAGVGKTAIAEGIALAISTKTAPAVFHKKRVMSVNISSLVSGTRFRGDFEERIENLIKEVKDDGNIILFIDELHTLVGSGSAIGGMDAGNMLKPALARGELHCIGATTEVEYRRYIRKDQALDRRFQKVKALEPSLAVTAKIIDGVLPNLAKHHGVSFDQQAVQSALQLTNRFMPTRRFPDKAIDVLDEAGAHVRLLKRDRVTDRDMETVVARLAGFPVGAVSNDESKGLQTLAGDIRRGVFGQDAAVEQVADAIIMQRVGILDPNRPAAAFLFVGPTGVGKTELAKALAKALGIHFQRFDMSEYQDRHTLSTLVGAPPGFVGHESGGLLTNAISDHPHSVLLLDEIEKAHPDIFNTFLQVMDDGRLTDHQGQVTDFTNTIIIMTSNAGATQGSRAPMGFTRNQEDQRSQSIEAALNRLFTPEFRNRLTATVEFSPLSQDTVTKVIEKILGKTERRLMEKHSAPVHLKVTSQAKSKLADLSYDPLMGARPAERKIRELIWAPIAKEIAFGSLKNGGAAIVDLDAEGNISVRSNAK